VKYYHLMVGAQGQTKWAKAAKKSFTYDVTHKKPAPPTPNFFSSAQYKTCRIFWHFGQVRNVNQSRDIPAQSHVRFMLFFCEPLELTRKSKC